ncbi:hypothetical protein CTAYLR_009961 [Chrysophaeum taylorii]|uniref:Alcohol dehydrogenase n=1 Tax=Chrysophaeum taylorii TaxID=2483200 RepID=A0AAD7U9W1_9STRA|nr:hypothetical protein CTAYLR_009961 [Chrysophaeum taylorii]
MSSFSLCRRLIVGGGSVSQVGSVLEGLGRRRPLIVADPVLLNNGAVAQVQKAIEAPCFADTIPDPTTESVERLVSRLASGDYDAIVAVGGGSPMDTAKAAAAVHEWGGPLPRFKVPAQVDGELMKTPIVAIPTTAGTGSEVTRFTVVTDSATGEKNLYAGTAFVPAAAIADYRFTTTCPRRLTADTGIDALCHAMEAYVSKRRNWFSDGMALAAIEAIGRSLRASYHRGEDSAREAMMLAATQAGLAFSNSSVTLIHGMSRPLGAHFHVPHGLSNAMLAPLVTRYSLRGAKARYAKVARCLGVITTFSGDDDEVASDAAASDEDAADAAAAEALPAALAALNADLEVPTIRDLLYAVGIAARYGMRLGVLQRPSPHTSHGINITHFAQRVFPGGGVLRFVRRLPDRVLNVSSVAALEALDDTTKEEEEVFFVTAHSMLKEGGLEGLRAQRKNLTSLDEFLSKRLLDELGRPPWGAGRARRKSMAVHVRRGTRHKALTEDSHFVRVIEAFLLLSVGGSRDDVHVYSLRDSREHVGFNRSRYENFVRKNAVTFHLDSDGHDEDNILRIWSDFARAAVMPPR